MLFRGKARGSVEGWLCVGRMALQWRSQSELEIRCHTRKYHCPFLRAESVLENVTAPKNRLPVSLLSLTVGLPMHRTASLPWQFRHLSKNTASDVLKNTCIHCSKINHLWQIVFLWRAWNSGHNSEEPVAIWHCFYLHIVKYKTLTNRWDRHVSTQMVVVALESTGQWEHAPYLFTELSRKDLEQLNLTSLAVNICNIFIRI